jgi:hypothetical protein
MSRQHPGESYRHAVAARRAGGGSCTILIRRVDDRVELLFHADPTTGAVLTPADAEEIAEALRQAASSPP